MVGMETRFCCGIYCIFGITFELHLFSISASSTYYPTNFCLPFLHFAKFHLHTRRNIHVFNRHYERSWSFVLTPNYVTWKGKDVADFDTLLQNDLVVKCITP